MEIRSVQALAGPNRWCSSRALAIQVDTSSCPQAGPEFADRIRSCLPPSTRAIDATWSPAEWLAEATLQLQTAAGVHAAHAEARRLPATDRWLVTVEYEEEPLARACLETARRLCLAAAEGAAWSKDAEIRQLVDIADDVRMGPTTLAIVRAAEARGIPFHRPTPAMLIRLGEGTRQRRIWTSMTDRTSGIGVDLASDKELTRRFLTSVGVPVPAGRGVRDAEDAWAAACEIGLPVTVKPRDANHARGVTLEARTREQVVGGFECAEKECKGGVIVERFIYGLNWRLLVVGQQLVAATRGNRRVVTGDGVRSVAQLIDDTNRDPGRGLNYTDLLDPIEIKHPLVVWLARQGYTPDSIPAAGANVSVQMVGDMTTEVTDQVHPRNVRHAVLAARVVGLDVAGLDIVAEDISRPLEEQAGAIVEVNAGPSLKMHLDPLEGKPRPVGEAIINSMFAAGETGRIPIVVVAGGGDRAAIANRLGERLRHLGLCVGVATPAGVLVDGDPIALYSRTDRERAESLLMHPDVQVAVVQCQSDEALSVGLPVPRCDVLVVPEIPRASVDELPLEDVPEDLAPMVAALAAVRAVSERGVALLPDVASVKRHLVAHCAGKIALFSSCESDELVDRAARAVTELI